MGNWNFRGYIAIQLEEYSNQYLEDNTKTADEIESGAFVETMYSILDKKYKPNEECNFTYMCSDYLDLPASKIPKEDAKKIFSEFERLMKEN